MKILLSFFLVFFFSFSLHSQIVGAPDTVNDEEVTELSAVQTISNTFLAALMVRHSSGMEAMKIYRSANNGITWDSVFFKGHPNFLIKYPDPVLCTDNAGNIYAGVMGGNSSYYDIWIFKSTDDGLTWNFLSKPYGGSDVFCDLPSINSRNGVVYVSYSAGTDHIAFKRSLNGGITWQDTAKFFPANPGGNIYPSHLDWTTGNRLCLSYADYTDTKIYFTSSKDSGLNWKSVKSITVPASANVTKLVSSKNFSHLGIIANRPHVNTDLYYLTSLDTGNTWSSQTIGNNSANCEGAIDASGNVHVIYNEIISPTSRLAYKYSIDKGQTFSSVVSLLTWTNTAACTAGEYQSLIFANDGLLHVTYIDWNDKGAARHLIFAPLLMDIYQTSPSTHAPHIFPNPVRDVLSFESDNTNSNATYELTGMDGKIISSGKVEIPTTTQDVSALSKGIYLLRVNNGILTYVQKIVKQ